MEEKDSNEKNLLKKIKSIYILKEIIDYLPYIKFLNTIKYNKEIQNRLNINIKENFKIEIEIKLCYSDILYQGAENGEKSSCEKSKAKFINIQKYYKPYFHIYFNDNKEESKQYSEFKVDKI